MDISIQVRVPLKISVKSKDVVVDIQKRVSTVTDTVNKELFLLYAGHPLASEKVMSELNHI